MSVHIIGRPRRVLGGLSRKQAYRWEVDTSDGMRHAFETQASAEQYCRKITDEAARQQEAE